MNPRREETSFCRLRWDWDCQDLGLWAGAVVETVQIIEWVDLKESIGATGQEPKHAEAPTSKVKFRRTGALYMRGGSDGGNVWFVPVPVPAWSIYHSS